MCKGIVLFIQELVKKLRWGYLKGLSSPPFIWVSPVSTLSTGMFNFTSDAVIMFCLFGGSSSILRDYQLSSGNFRAVPLDRSQVKNREKIEPRSRRNESKEEEKNMRASRSKFSPREIWELRDWVNQASFSKKISPGASIPNDAGPLNFSSARYLGVDCYMQREEIRRHL